MSKASMSPTLPYTTLVICVLAGVVAAFVATVGETGGRSMTAPAGNVDEEAVAHRGESHLVSDDPVTLERQPIPHGAADISSDPSSQEGKAELTLSRSAQLALQGRMYARIQESRLKMERALVEEGWGSEYARSAYLLMRYEIAFEKLLEGDFEVDYGPGPYPVRREGEPDFMSFWTSDDRDGRRLYAKITMDEADEARMSDAKRVAAEETIKVWQSFVDSFNALELGERKKRIQRSLRARKEISDLVRGEDGAANGGSESSRGARLRHLKQQVLPWYLKTDNVMYSVSIPSWAWAAAHKSGGF